MDFDGRRSSDEKSGLGGVIQGRMFPTSEEERERGIAAGLDMEKIYATNDLVSGDNCYFSATGITTGDLLQGLRLDRHTIHTQSLAMRSATGTVRVIDAEHSLTKWN
ncbi:fructose-bisphosphatase class II [Glutamicibacter nicotianae]